MLTTALIVGTASPRSYRLIAFLLSPHNSDKTQRFNRFLSLSRLSRSGNSFIFCASYGADSRNRQRQSVVSMSASVAPGPPLNGIGRSPHPWHETSWYLICNGNTCHYRHIPRASSGSSQYIELCSRTIPPSAGRGVASSG